MGGVDPKYTIHRSYGQQVIPPEMTTCEAYNGAGEHSPKPLNRHCILDFSCFLMVKPSFGECEMDNLLICLSANIHLSIGWKNGKNVDRKVNNLID